MRSISLIKSTIYKGVATLMICMTFLLTNPYSVSFGIHSAHAQSEYSDDVKYSNSTLEKAISFFAGIGGAGIVLLVVMSTTGFAGAVAIVVALSTLGGPFGMLGGLAAIGALSVMFYGLSTYGVEFIVSRFVVAWQADGKTRAEIERDIRNLPPAVVGDSTKQKAIQLVRENMK